MSLAAQLLVACGQSGPVIAPQAPLPPVELTVLAASSLTDALPKVVDAWKAHGGTTVAFSFDSSSKLVKQVEAGAPVDLLFTADRETMDGVDGKGLLLAGTRRDLLGNTLVLVVPATSTWTPASAAEVGSPSLQHLALSGENVPAGKYARAALEAAGVWSAVEARAVSGDNVRTTLAWVSRGEAEAGVVYATDARAQPKVKVAFAFPAGSHPPIAYPVAVVGKSTHPDEARSFLAFCASADGMKVFGEAGFTEPPGR